MHVSKYLTGVKVHGLEPNGALQGVQGVVFMHVFSIGFVVFMHVFPRSQNAYKPTQEKYVVGEREHDRRA